MRTIISYISFNRKILLGMTAGGILGYIYWHFFGDYWSAFSLNSVSWVNCIYGATLGGLFSKLTKS